MLVVEEIDSEQAISSSLSVVLTSALNLAFRT
jgi:hypothetical protein